MRPGTWRVETSPVLGCTPVTVCQTCADGACSGNALCVPACPVYRVLRLQAASEGSPGPTACTGVRIQELCSVRSLRCLEQPLWPPLSLSSRSSLTSGRELLEARARVCLHSAPPETPAERRAPRPLSPGCFCGASKQQLRQCPRACFLKLPFQPGCCRQMKRGNCPMCAVAEDSLYSACQLGQVS